MKKIISITLLAAVLVPALLYAVLGTDDQNQKKKRKRAAAATEIIKSNPDGKGIQLTVEFTKGSAHNHPLMAIWIEDMEGRYIQTLYVAQSIATSKFRRGTAEWGQWKEGLVRRPAALPYWGHQRGIKADDGLYLPTPENPVPDAYSGATPQSDFVLQSRADSELPARFRVLLEINQAWDWNNYWTNSKFPEDADYKTSSQPALVYEAVVDTSSGSKEFEMKPIGHSHYSGKDGSLTKDLTTLTTAMEIARKVVVKVR